MYGSENSVGVGRGGPMLRAGFTAGFGPLRLRHGHAVLQGNARPVLPSFEDPGRWRFVERGGHLPESMRADAGHRILIRVRRGRGKPARRDVCRGRCACDLPGSRDQLRLRRCALSTSSSSRLTPHSLVAETHRLRTDRLPHGRGSASGCKPDRRFRAARVSKRFLRFFSSL
jgi:hypothetical protein